MEVAADRAAAGHRGQTSNQKFIRRRTSVVLLNFSAIFRNV